MMQSNNTQSNAAAYRVAYERRVAPLRPHAGVLAALSRVLVAGVAVAFAALLALLAAVGQGSACLRVAAVCAATFALVTALRAAIDAPRPYEPPTGIEPLVPKGTRGRSFPSRHVASAFVIACAFTWAAAQHVAAHAEAPAALAAAVAFAVAAAIAVLRVLAGHHFPRDVVAAAALALACALVGFVLV